MLLEATTGCSHRCQMCTAHSPRLSRPTPAQNMPFDQIERLLTEAAGLGVEEVWLAGRGEPLIHPQAMEILELIGSLGMQGEVTTNGQPLREELLDRLCGVGLRQLSISIDSGRAETYARVHQAPAADRARLLGVIQQLAQRGKVRPKLLVSMVLTKLNRAEILELVRDAIEAGVDGVVIGGMRPVPFDSSDLALEEQEWALIRDDLARAAEMTRQVGVELWTDSIPSGGQPSAEAWPYQEMACFIGHTFSVVDVQGIVHGCCTCQNRLGDLTGSSFAQVWRGRSYQLYRKLLRELPSSGLTPPRCDCRYGCGHIGENQALQQAFAFSFPRSVPETDFVTRLELARAVGRTLFASAAEGSAEEFADLGSGDVPGEARRHAANLRRLGVILGTGSLGGKPLFDPRRLVSREEAAEVLRRALVASGHTPAQAGELAAAACEGPPRPDDVLTKRDLGDWLAALSSRTNARL